ncbi:MAG: winged helix-turn-helix transcriptional regulator [Deltaproteobacteria bacterium]|nr:winged helix-turn-helix transcriptional regulator [Deltaproteobacteria bacterium]
MEEIERVAIYRLHAQFCKTLSDANRLLIMAELVKGERSVSELVERLGLQQANVSKHLALMRDRGLVTMRREGASAYYSLSDARIFEAIKMLMQVQADQFERQHNLANRAE